MGRADRARDILGRKFQRMIAHCIHERDSLEVLTIIRHVDSLDVLISVASGKASAGQSVKD